MISLFSNSQIRNADKYAIDELNIPGIVLMENASNSIYGLIKKHFTNLNINETIGIICGKGNNGGDGFAVARKFANDGFNVIVFTLAADKELKGDALQNYSILNNLKSKLNNIEIIQINNIKDLNKTKKCDYLIDAILGTGSVGKLKPPYDKIVEALNKVNAKKISIDVPTGLNSDTGFGEIVFNAELTVTLADYKKGLFVNHGKLYSGKIEKGSIGIGSEYFAKLEVKDYLIEPEDALHGIPKTKINAHKYSAGKVLVIAGSKQMPGAAFLSANSAVQAGAGAVYLFLPEIVEMQNAGVFSSPIIKKYPDSDLGFLSEQNIHNFEDEIKWADSILIGPGLGRNSLTITAIEKILKHNNENFIIDADAIYAISKIGIDNVKLKNRILTPHLKEFSYLIGKEIEEIAKDLLKYGKEFATKNETYLVLKGAPTIIFNPNGEAFINSAGNQGMAKFGVGDVLAGLISGFVAKTENKENAIISSVYIHSLSADLLLKKQTEFGISAEKIINNIPTTIKFLENSINV